MQENGNSCRKKEKKGDWTPELRKKNLQGT
jgi:hypothetical protein